MRRLVTSLSIVLAMATLVSQSAGHDLRGLVAERSSLDPETQAKFDEVKELRQLLATRSAANRDQGLEAVVQTILRWPTGQATVCFFDGQQAARNHVAEIAQKWSQSTSMKFDF